MRAVSLARTLLVTAVAIGVLPVVGAQPAYACSCVQTDERHRYEQATHVFKGTVLAVQGAATPEGQVSNQPVVYTFNVISTYKGRVTDPQKVSTPGNSAACGVELDGDGPFLVFASRQPEGDAQPAGSELRMDLCGGTRPIGENDEPTFGRPAAAPDQDPGEPTPAAPPTPAPEKDPGLTSTLITNLGGLISQLGGLAGKTPPPGG